MNLNDAYAAADAVRQHGFPATIMRNPDTGCRCVRVEMPYTQRIAAPHRNLDGRIDEVHHWTREGVAYEHCDTVADVQEALGY